MHGILQYMLALRKIFSLLIESLVHDILSSHHYILQSLQLRFVNEKEGVGQKATGLWL